jgi:hypothetical protein
MEAVHIITMPKKNNGLSSAEGFSPTRCGECKQKLIELKRESVSVNVIKVCVTPGCSLAIQLPLKNWVVYDKTVHNPEAVRIVNEIIEKKYDER